MRMTTVERHRLLPRVSFGYSSGTLRVGKHALRRVPGHKIVGRVTDVVAQVSGFPKGA